MTWGGGKPHAVGDRGQRYEVTYRDPEQDQKDFEKIAKERGYSRDWINAQTPKRRIMGWAATKEGATSFLEAIALHPVWCDGEVRDRETETPTEPCADCDGKGHYPTGATCKSCGGSGRVSKGSTSAA